MQQFQFKEELLHFIWQSGVLFKGPLDLTNGDPLTIIQPGNYNRDAGPDFFNARIQIANTIWAGNIEFHILSSDWELHKHHLDTAYHNVILHVVYFHDKEIYYPDGRAIPTLELRSVLPPLLLKRYSYLQKNRQRIPCETLFSKPNSLQLRNWFDRLLVERLERKTEAFSLLLTRYKGNWEQAFYIYTARYFGMKTNALPFEMLAQHVPLQTVSRHKNNLKQLIAIYFGVAGLIDHLDECESKEVKTEFDFLKKKYRLPEMNPAIWKFSRTRPANFPDKRLLQFVNLVHHSTHLFSGVLETASLSGLRMLYQRCSNEERTLSFGTTDLILLNSVMPVVYLYGQRMYKPELQDRVITFYESLKAEKNHIIAMWDSLGLHAESAFDSQALIELKMVYCDQQKCLSCAIGKHILLNEKSS